MNFWQIVVQIITIIISSMIGVFFMSNIILPLFVALPRILKVRKKFPVFILIQGSIWIAVLIFVFKFFTDWQPHLKIAVTIGISISGLLMINKVFKGGEDMEDDIRRSYGDDITKS